MDPHSVQFLQRHGYVTDRVLHDDAITVVSLCHRHQHRYAVKCIQGCHPCTVYEYQVGCRVYEASQQLGSHLRIAGQTVDLLTDPDANCQYLVTEYLPGVTLQTVVATIADQRTSPTVRHELLRRYVAMLRTIHEFERRTGFTHYDLHLGNIITDDDLVTFKLLDYGYAHYPGVTGAAATTDTALSIGAIPSVYDPWFDVVRLVTMLYLHLGWIIPPDMGDLLVTNGFSPWLDLPGTPYSDHIASPVQKYPGSELLVHVDLIDFSPEELWEPDYGGFWVGDEKVPCRDDGNYRDEDFSSVDSVDDGVKHRFGDFVTCLKRYTMDKRVHNDPASLIDLVERDIGRLVTDEGTGATKPARQSRAGS